MKLRLGVAGQLWIAGRCYHRVAHLEGSCKCRGAEHVDKLVAAACVLAQDCEKASDAHLLKSDITQKCFTDAPVMAKAPIIHREPWDNREHRSSSQSVLPNQVIFCAK
eukprot:1496941-Amphidinium_carterae.1